LRGRRTAVRNADRHCLGDHQLNVPSQFLAEGLSLDIRHHGEGEGRTVGLQSHDAGIIEGKDVRMLQAGGDSNFMKEALATTPQRR